MHHPKMNETKGRVGEASDMIFEERYFEDYSIGQNLATLGRTITEADIVATPARPETSFPIIWTPNGARL